MNGLVRAAGGVVWRHRPGTPGIEIALVHRPRYDDWSLPKGKLDAGESALDAAVREIDEEIGATVAVGRWLTTTHYVVRGSDKRVDYWAMRWLGGSFTVSTEVDELRWLPIEDARARLSYDLDRSVLAEFLRLPVADSIVVLLRHAKAGKRVEWSGDDRERPLERDGLRQAARLAALLPAFAPTSVLSADRVRCVQTVEPLAAALGLRVQIAPEFSDESYLEDPAKALLNVRALAEPGRVTVVCSQGTAIPGIIEQLELGAHRTPLTRKAAFWVLSYADGELLAADYYQDAIR